MALITPDTFDPLSRFVSVRLQQGVPIVDADWNEMDDVRRFEMRAHSHWYVGSGVPYGSDAFRIAAAAIPAANNVVIGAGVPPPPLGENRITIGLRHVGRCLVEGVETTIDADVQFRSQALHTSQAGSANLATRWGTPVVAEMAVLNGNVCVYLDVWDRLVRPDELPTLVFPDIGTESCARVKREWAVRSRVGTAAPIKGDPDFFAGHAYYALARIARVAADPIVYPGQITDLRERQLLTPPSTLIDDVLGTTPERYRRGLDRPAVSIRTALNALMRGELPSSDDQVIAPDINNDFPARAVAIDGGTVYYLWFTNRVAAANQIFATSWPVDNPAAATAAPVQVTTLVAQTPALVLLPTSPAPTLFVAYHTQNDIRFKVAPSVAGLAAAPENPIAAQAEVERHPILVRTGQIVTAFWFWDGAAPNKRIRYRRRQYLPTWAEGTAIWLDGETTAISTIRPALPANEPGLMHGAGDAAGRVWFAFSTFSNNIAVARLTTASGAIETWTNTELDSTTADRQPFVLIGGVSRVWVFWRADNGIFHSMHDVAANTWGPALLVPGTAAGLPNDNQRPTAVLDPDGGIWLLWSQVSAGDPEIWAVRRNALTGGWGTPRQITASMGENDYPVAIADTGLLRLFFRSNRSGQFDLFTKSIVTSI